MEVERFFAGSVAAAYNCHGASAEEEAVACGASRHAEAAKTFFVGQAEVFSRGAGTYNHCGSTYDSGSTVDIDGERTFREVDRCYLARYYLSAETLCLRPEILHHLRAGDSCGISGEVLDVGGGGELSAGLESFYEHGFQIGARGVYGGGVSGGACADYEAVGVYRGHCLFWLKG